MHVCITKINDKLKVIVNHWDWLNVICDRPNWFFMNDIVDIDDGWKNHEFKIWINQVSDAVSVIVTIINDLDYFIKLKVKMRSNNEISIFCF